MAAPPSLLGQFHRIRAAQSQIKALAWSARLGSIVAETGQRGRTAGVATAIDPLAGDEMESDGMAIIRFSSQLLPGQPQTISIPAALSIQGASL